MTGLELITDKILSDAQQEADIKLATAKDRIKEINEEYAEECKRARSEGEQKKSALKKQAEEACASALRAREREALLSAQNEAASQIIAEAKDRILNLDTAEYFAFLTAIYKNASEDKKGELLLCAEDRMNMPQDFIDSLNKISEVTLSSEEAPSRGFIIRYGKIEQNCTIDAIFEDKINLLSDIVAAHCKE